MPEQPKKPVGGAYGVFMTEKRPEFTKQCQGQKASAVSKLGGEAWKKLTDAQKAPYEKKYIEVKAKYDKDLAAFLAAGGELQKGAAAMRTQKRKEKNGKAKKKKDPNAPKKPVGGAYGVYLSENREKIMKSLPAGSKCTAVSKAAGEQWKKLPEAEKKPYEAKLAKKVAEYKKAMEEYKNNNPEEGEDDEEEGEDDDDEEEEEAEEASPPKKKGKKA